MLNFIIGILVGIFADWDMVKTLLSIGIIGFYTGLMIILMANTGLKILFMFSLPGLLIGTISGFILSFVVLLFLILEGIFGFMIGRGISYLIKKR